MCIICQNVRNRSRLGGNFRRWWPWPSQQVAGPTFWINNGWHREPPPLKSRKNSSGIWCPLGPRRPLWPWTEATHVIRNEIEASKQKRERYIPLTYRQNEGRRG